MVYRSHKLLSGSVLGVALGSMAVGSALAQPSIMVAGDSISAGYYETSYRLPMLDALENYGCPVSMVGDQTLNTFDYRQPQTSTNGTHVSPFSPANGYDTDHQAFSAITADEYANGVTSTYYTVSPVATYVANEQPDFVLVHLGTNDMGRAFRSSNQMSSDVDINAWANTTLSDVRRVIDRTIGAHNNPSSLRVLVANFIPYARDTKTAAELVRAKRASKLFTQRLESMVLDRGDSRVLIVDVETGFNPDIMTSDGIHPNRVGEEHMAGAFLPVLRGAGLCPNTPGITSPTSGSTVNGDSTIVSWTNNGFNVSGWRVRIGDSQSGESSTYFDSGNLSQATTSVEVSDLPANQNNLFVSLQYSYPGGSDVVLSSFLNRSGTGGSADPSMQSPLAGSLLSSSSVNFSWQSNDRDISQWWVRIGNAPGGTEYFDSGRISDRSARSVSVSGLPNNGQTVYLELSARRGSAWIIQSFPYTAVGGGLPDKVLEPGEWYQIGLPYNPQSNNSVADVFGTALPVQKYATNGSLASDGSPASWKVFGYELNGNSQLQDNYKALALTDTVQVGQGYWILHLEDGPVTLTAPSGASANSSNVSGAQVAACANPGRCYAVPVNAVVTDGRTGRFTMLSYPLSNPTTALDVRVVANANVDCSGGRDCSLAEASNGDLFHNTLWAYDYTIGTNGDYDPVGPVSGVLNPWDGFWAVQLSDANSRNAALIMSEPESGS